MNVLLDANILVTILNQEQHFYQESAALFMLPTRHRVQLCSTTLSLAIAFYFAQKKTGLNSAKKRLRQLSSKMLILGISEQDHELAMINNQVLDYEDGLQYYAAKKAKCRYIITQDSDDFYFSEIPVVTPQNFLEQL